MLLIGITSVGLMAPRLARSEVGGDDGRVVMNRRKGASVEDASPSVPTDVTLSPLLTGVAAPSNPTRDPSVLLEAILFAVEGLRTYGTDDINIPTWFSVRYNALTGAKMEGKYGVGCLFDPFLYITAYRLTGNSTYLGWAEACWNEYASKASSDYLFGGSYDVVNDLWDPASMEPEEFGVDWSSSVFELNAYLYEITGNSTYLDWLERGCNRMHEIYRNPANGLYYGKVNLLTGDVVDPRAIFWTPSFPAVDYVWAYTFTENETYLAWAKDAFTSLDQVRNPITKLSPYSYDASAASGDDWGALEITSDVARQALTCYEMSGDPFFLDYAEDLIKPLIDFLWDESLGRFVHSSYLTGGVFDKDFFDWDVPIPLQVLALLGHYTGKEVYLDYADRHLEFVRSEMMVNGLIAPHYSMGSVVLVHWKESRLYYSMEGSKPLASLFWATRDPVYLDIAYEYAMSVLRHHKSARGFANGVNLENLQKTDPYVEPRWVVMYLTPILSALTCYSPDPNVTLALPPGGEKTNPHVWINVTDKTIRFNLARASSDPSLVYVNFPEEGMSISEVYIDGKRWCRFRPDQGSVILPPMDGKHEIKVKFSSTGPSDPYVLSLVNASLSSSDFTDGRLNATLSLPTGVPGEMVVHTADRGRPIRVYLNRYDHTSSECVDLTILEGLSESECKWCWYYDDDNRLLYVKAHAPSTEVIADWAPKPPPIPSPSPTPTPAPPQELLVLRSGGENEWYDPAEDAWKPAVEITWIHPGWEERIGRRGERVGIDAPWMWRSDMPLSSEEEVVSNSTVTFRRTFELPEPLEAMGRIAITADNEYELRVNGELIGSDASFGDAETYDITEHLRPGRNELEIKVLNVGTPEAWPEHPEWNPAGVIYEARISYRTTAP